MIQIKKTILTLALLLTAATGARADWTGGTYTATANENLGAITVNGDATLTINSDVTVTITGGINVASGTLTVTGPGTLVVNGAKGNDGASGWKGSNGGNGGVAISGNIIVQGGATVTATGGTGGNGGSGALEAGTGGNGGVAFAGTLTYKSGTVTANGGSAGSGGYIDDEEKYASSGSAGKAFANDVDFTQTTGYSVTNGTSTIGSVLNQTKVVISGGTEPAAPSGPEVAWDAAEKTGTFTMPGGNVTLEPEYYPQATVADGAVTAADADARATTDDPLVKVDATKLTGAKKLMYFVSNSGTTAPAYDAEGWTDQLPNAEGFTQQGIVYVWYYPVGTDEGVDGATATYSDGDICLQSITARIADAPTYAVTFAEGTQDADKWTVKAGTDGSFQSLPLEGVKAGTKVKLKYDGDRSMLKGVKAEKKGASTPLDNTTTAWTAGTYAVPAGGLTYSDAITVSGDVTLVLTDGETLTLNKGISLAEGATLTVEGNGTMNINGTNNSTASTVAGTGMLVLTSGTLNAKGGDGENGHSGWTSGGGNAINGAVTVSGGTLTATGGNGGSDNDGSGWRGAGAAAISGDVIITAGIVTAKGGNGGSLSGESDAYAGAGGNAINGNVTLSGGTLTKTDGNSGTKGGDADGYVGAGGKAVAGTVTDNR